MSDPRTTQPYREFRRLTRTIKCETCGAKPGEQCHSRTGKRSSFSHTNRIETAIRLRKEGAA